MPQVTDSGGIGLHERMPRQLITPVLPPRTVRLGEAGGLDGRVDRVGHKILLLTEVGASALKKCGETLVGVG
ncbi:Uncharacterised protein [Mycobacteroides abscessus subsp. abscessus]|nr:Uncharacterised protein [Mycobacteroides abscessus subsp. abscessus]